MKKYNIIVIASIVMGTYGFFFRVIPLTILGFGTLLVTCYIMKKKIKKTKIAINKSSY